MKKKEQGLVWRPQKLKEPEILVITYTGIISNSKVSNDVEVVMLTVGLENVGDDLAKKEISLEVGAKSGDSCGDKVLVVGNDDLILKENSDAMMLNVGQGNTSYDPVDPVVLGRGLLGIVLATNENPLEVGSLGESGGDKGLVVGDDSGSQFASRKVLSWKAWIQTVRNWLRIVVG